MGDTINGQVVPALGQWQGVALLVTATLVACAWRVLKRAWRHA